MSDPLENALSSIQSSYSFRFYRRRTALSRLWLVLRRSRYEFANLHLKLDNPSSASRPHKPCESKIGDSSETLPMLPSLRPVQKTGFSFWAIANEVPKRPDHDFWLNQVDDIWIRR